MLFLQVSRENGSISQSKLKLPLNLVIDFTFFAQELTELQLNWVWLTNNFGIGLL